MMGLFPYNPVEITALREEAQLYGLRISPTVAWELLRRTHHRGLAVDALLMEHRPVWVTEIAGPITPIIKDAKK